MGKLDHQAITVDSVVADLAAVDSATAHQVVATADLAAVDSAAAHQEVAVADLVVVDFHQAAEDFQVAVALDKETPIQTPMQAVQLAEEEVVQVLLDPVEKAQVLQ